MKPNFDRAEELARELRLMQTTNSLALDVLSMELDREIHFETFEHYAMLTGRSVEELTANRKIDNGYTIKYKGVYIVLYYENFFSPRLNWTLAHELGHIYLNHTSDGSIEEVEAHWFAAELLMPIPIIVSLSRKMNVYYYVLEDLFDVSINAALKRVDSLNRMCAFSTYLQKDFNDKYRESIKNAIERIKII